MDSILKYGLLSRKRIIEEGISFSDVADNNIISKRTDLELDDYIPFHFHPYSSFDVAVKQKYFNQEFIYICLTRENAQYNKFKILPRHPLNIKECQLMDYEEGFNSIDWEAMHTHGTDNEHIKNVKMAECLTHLVVPVEVFQCIYVKDKKTKSFVESKLKENNIFNKPPYVDVQKWF